MPDKVLVTGAAGFIGARTMQRLRERGASPVGLDNFNSYYDLKLKLDRSRSVRDKIYELDISHDMKAMRELFQREGITGVIHLAAQAGVRYSITNPKEYITSNLVGFSNILELCREFKVEHLVYASSSSVYGLNSDVPFNTENTTDHPASLYAATKKANELMAHSYSHLYKLPTTGLRFFTVYGPWGRPDMAPFLFTEAILKGEPIKVFNYGDMSRDFTYIDDIVDGVIGALEKVAAPDVLWSPGDPKPNSSSAPYRIYNLGNSSPVKLLDFIGMLEKSLNKKAKLELLPMQAGDVQNTYAHIHDSIENIGYLPMTPIETGITAFTDWYRTYYNC